MNTVSLAEAIRDASTSQPGETKSYHLEGDYRSDELKTALFRANLQNPLVSLGFVRYDRSSKLFTIYVQTKDLPETG